MLLAPYHKLLGTKCQVDGSTEVDTSCLRAYQPVEGFQAYATSIAELWHCLTDAWYVLDVSMGKGYKYSLLSENLIVRGKNYAEYT